ncbi:hypothetical protein LEP1GSC048_0001 [Leptospira santarosai serovar Shermani str. 1342KT]|nr:hypothetical protein LEP1GSC048_0001 [Leptospira santarosai serovar Shermani str. 1342KT]
MKLNLATGTKSFKLRKRLKKLSERTTTNSRIPAKLIFKRLYLKVWVKKLSVRRFTQCAAHKKEKNNNKSG